MHIPLYRDRNNDNMSYSRLDDDNRNKYTRCWLRAKKPPNNSEINGGPSQMTNIYIYWPEHIYILLILSSYYLIQKCIYYISLRIT